MVKTGNLLSSVCASSQRPPNAPAVMMIPICIPIPEYRAQLVRDCFFFEFGFGCDIFHILDDPTHSAGTCENSTRFYCQFVGDDVTRKFGRSFKCQQIGNIDLAPDSS